VYEKGFMSAASGMETTIEIVVEAQEAKWRIDTD
jgi:hypothetical protein